MAAISNWLSIPQAADILGVDRSTVFRWMKDGKLQPLGTVGKRVIFDRAYIERLAKEIGAKETVA